jgi:cytochrome c6
MSSENLHLSRSYRGSRILLALLFSLATLGQVASAATGTSQKAASTFEDHCVSCHGSDGAGTPLGKRLQAPDLSSKEVQSQSSASLARAISEGKNNMPPFADRLSAQQIQALADYVHRLGKKAGAKAK